MESNKLTALVTGASMGIGYEIARQLAEKGHNLILVARSQYKLEEIANDLEQKYEVKVSFIAKDLMQAGAAEDLYHEVLNLNQQVDILVNNAGQGVKGKFTETSLFEELEIIQLNIISLVTLTKLFLKDMISRNNGKILQVSSMVEKTGSPLMAVYSGTKSFVYNFTQSVINEINDTDVTMTVLLPGATDTDFFTKADAEDAKIAQDKESLANAETVAKDGIDALFSGKTSIVSGIKNKIMATMSNVTPDQVLATQMHDNMKDVDKKEKDN